MDQKSPQNQQLSLKQYQSVSEYKAREPREVAASSQFTMPFDNRSSRALLTSDASMLVDGCQEQLESESNFGDIVGTVNARLEDYQLQIKASGLEWDKRHAYIDVQKGIFCYKKEPMSPTPNNEETKSNSDEFVEVDLRTAVITKGVRNKSHPYIAIEINGAAGKDGAENGLSKEKQELVRILFESKQEQAKWYNTALAASKSTDERGPRASIGRQSNQNNTIRLSNASLQQASASGATLTNSLTVANLQQQLTKISVLHQKKLTTLNNVQQSTLSSSQHLVSEQEKQAFWTAVQERFGNGWDSGARGLDNSAGNGTKWQVLGSKDGVNFYVRESAYKYAKQLLDPQIRIIEWISELQQRQGQSGTILKEVTTRLNLLNTFAWNFVFQAIIILTLIMSMINIHSDNHKDMSQMTSNDIIGGQDSISSENIMHDVKQPEGSPSKISVLSISSFLFSYFHLESNLVWIKEFVFPRVLSLLLMQVVLRFSRQFAFYLFRKDKTIDNYIQPVTHTKSQTVVVAQTSLCQTSYDQILEHFSMLDHRSKWDPNACNSTQCHDDDEGMGDSTYITRKVNVQKGGDVHIDTKLTHFGMMGMLYILESKRIRRFGGKALTSNFVPDTLWIFEGQKLTVQYCLDQQQGSNSQLEYSLIQTMPSSYFGGLQNSQAEEINKQQLADLMTRLSAFRTSLGIEALAQPRS